ncbi:MAG: putative regulatory protein FmdB family [Chthoniobacteraceae bacterium]|nr:putative regulatory protein FmdB family [Chthoniobacteraceae bacterium]
MPIYEFYSPQTRKIYTFFARSLALSGKIPRCPDDPGCKMERMISSFAVTGKKPGREQPRDADPARAARIVSTMERELGGMDEAHPDPRQVARLAKAMSELHGTKMPGAMNDLIRRLEAGEDPDKLDAEYGEELESSDFFGENPAGADGKEDSTGRRRRAVLRDPTLYEMAHYVE